MKKIYQLLAKQAGVKWKGRNYDHTQWDNSDTANRCISIAAVLAAGYAPAIGFIHTGKPLSFVYDIAGLFKFDDIIPHAFKFAAKNYRAPERGVRLMCRDIFRQNKIIKKILPTIEEVLAAGELQLPKSFEESIALAIPNPESIGDVGHRS